MNYIPDAISVVIPTYNRAHLIKASIQSVLDQTLQPYEIIVVDDFSTDNTEEVVNSFNSPLIKYVKNQRKKGANGARNTGILMAKGEFIAFQDSDDIWLKDKLGLQLSEISKNKTQAMCFCSLLIRGEKNEIIPKIKIKNISKWLKYKNFISTQTIFIKSNIAKSILFDENIKRLQDWDFVLRVSQEHLIVHLNEILVYQNLSQNSISNNEDILDAYDLLFKKYPELKNYGPYNRIIYFEISKEYLKKIDKIYKYIVTFFLKVSRYFCDINFGK